MTTELLPCPLCFVAFEKIYDEGNMHTPSGYKHLDGTDCALRWHIVRPREYAAWNRRASAPDVPEIARYMCKGREVIDLQTNETIGEWSTPMQASYCTEAMNNADRRARALHPSRPREDVCASPRGSTPAETGWRPIAEAPDEEYMTGEAIEAARRMDDTIHLAKSIAAHGTPAEGTIWFGYAKQLADTLLAAAERIKVLEAALTKIAYGDGRVQPSGDVWTYRIARKALQP